MDRTFETTALIICCAAAPVRPSAAPDTTRIGTEFEVIGEGRIAIYDDKFRDGRWYYYLSPGNRFSLVRREVTGR